MERLVGFEPTMQGLQPCALPDLAINTYKLILSLSANYLVPQQATSGKFFVLTNNPTQSSAYISDFLVSATLGACGRD